MGNQNAFKSRARAILKLKAFEARQGNDGSKKVFICSCSMPQERCLGAMTILAALNRFILAPLPRVLAKKEPDKRP